MPVGQRLVIVFKRVYPNEMSEMALAHTVSDKVEAA
jgi:sorbitol-specific phosphotransferase system component IIA